jgi:dephospho-CoA kinase
VLKLKKIAITGGISSGKSTVCRFLAQRGSYVVSADEIVHKLLASDPKIQKQVIELLGNSVLIEGQISRKAVAEKVFSDLKKLKSLELILHPAVFNEINKHYQSVKENPKYNLFVAEVPLLYESQKEGLFDFVAVVLSERIFCEKRFIETQNSSKEAFEKRMQRQMQPLEKAAKADFILLNNHDLEDLKTQVTQLLTKLDIQNESRR